MLKLLYFTTDYSRFAVKRQEYFKTELRNLLHEGVVFYDQSAHIKDILSKLRFRPDFIFFDDYEYTGTVYGLGKVHIPKGVLIGDLHRNQDQFRQFVEDNEIDLIFSICRDPFLHNFPEYASRFRWLPHHVYPGVFKDYQLPKTIDYLVMGAVMRKIYPLRFKIVTEMRGTPGFVYHGHPGYKELTAEQEKNFYLGEKYAREINRAKIFFTDDSIFKYPLAKYFETLACNTLLMAPGSAELRDLGFIDQETFVEINAQNYFSKAKYYLKHAGERQRIAHRGYDMVMNRHTTTIRAKQFVEYIERFV